MRPRGPWRAVLAAVLVCSMRVGAQTGPAALAKITYERDWPEQQVPFYRFVVHGDGSGVFTTERSAGRGQTANGVASPAPASGTPTAAESGQAEQPAVAAAGDGGVSAIHVSEKTTARLFAVQAALRSGKGCQGGNRHLAQTGKKVLTIEDGAGVQTCSFNYSEDKRVEDAVAAFGAMATTLEERPLLEHLRRYDRLGLDAELGNFLESVQAGRAIEVGNLASVLKQLASDDALMDRVRSRASTLLMMAQAGS